MKIFNLEINENPNSNYQPNDYEKGNIKTQEIKEQELNLEKKSDNIENDNVLGLYHNNMKFVEKEIAEINQDERKIHQTAESKNKKIKSII